MPPTVIIIRHAEKELGGLPPFGITADGSRDPESLTVRGWQRAGALVGLFMNAPTAVRTGGLGQPSHLFASRVGDTTSLSRRPRETLMPLSERLAVTMDERFLKSQVGELVDAIRACEGIVLVAWEHRMIPPIAASLSNDPAFAQRIWPDDRFDMVWVFQPDGSGAAYSFRQVPQMLLAGDNAATF